MSAFQWVDIKTVAALLTQRLAMEVAPRRLYGWVEDARIRARRLADGTGPVRVLLGADGLPVDANAPPPPELGPRWVSLEEAAREAGVTTECVRVWARQGRVVARQVVRGVGAWRVALDWEGLPADGNGPRAAEVARAATAAEVAAYQLQSEQQAAVG